MWAVIQHGSVEKMEYYLPVLAKAVQEGEMHKTPFKMLLDRVHCIRYNYQFWGSQSGGNSPCEVASDEERKRVEEKYGL